MWLYVGAWPVFGRESCGGWEEENLPAAASRQLSCILETVLLLLLFNLIQKYSTKFDAMKLWAVKDFDSK